MGIPYVPVRERPATHEYDDRLTNPLAEGTEIVADQSGGVDTFTCDTCGDPAQFVVWRDTLSPVWGMAGIDGADSDVYAITCGKHTIN